MTTAGDNEGNKDYKDLNSKAYGLFKHGQVQRIEFVTGEKEDHVKIKCERLPEMKKNLKYKLNMTRTKYRGTGWEDHLH